jgi:hypothetical protein
MHVYASQSCYNITHAFNYHIASCNCDSSMHMVGHVEPEPGVQVEQAQAKDFANLVLDQVKPRCI